MAGFYPQGLLRKHLGKNQSSRVALLWPVFTRRAFSEGIWVKIRFPVTRCHGLFYPEVVHRRHLGKNHVTCAVPDSLDQILCKLLAISQHNLCPHFLCSKILSQRSPDPATGAQPRLVLDSQPNRNAKMMHPTANSDKWVCPLVPRRRCSSESISWGAVKDGVSLSLSLFHSLEFLFISFVSTKYDNTSPRK